MGAEQVPIRLGPAGRAFWRAVVKVYEGLEPQERELLTQACSVLDVIAELEATVKADGVMLTGSQGQPVLNPAIGEARLQRAELRRLLDQLGLPGEEDSEAVPSSPASRQARKAAMARWNRRRPA